MSHFIEEVNLVGPLTFSLTEPTEIKQNMKTYFRNNTLKKFLDNKQDESVLEKYCQRYSSQDPKKVQLQHEMFTQCKLSDVRKKLKESFNTEIDQKYHSGSFYHSNQLKNRKLQIKERVPEKLNKNCFLDQKKRNKMKNKLANALQAKKIAQNKENNRKQINYENRNSNPNLSKMTYLLDKITKIGHQIRTQTEASQGQNLTKYEQSFSDDLLLSSHKKAVSNNIQFILRKKSPQNKFKKFKKTNNILNKTASFHNLNAYSFFSNQ